MGSGTVWEWTAFGVVIAIFLAVDLLLHRGDHPESRKRAVIWSIITIAVGLGFGFYVWAEMGSRHAQEYLAAYLLEESLSLDNLFVFLIIFRMMRIPKEHQRVALSWGIFGALVFRGIFVFLGLEVLHRWSWVEYFFAGLLLYAAWHAFREDPSATGEDNKLVAWLTRHLPVSRPQGEPHFFAREDGKLKTTPLFVAILGLEASDVMFAVDSVPAAFSVTTEPFLIYTSNVFAILGLRSLYIVLAHTIAEMRYLHYGLAAVLAFAGMKMLLGLRGFDIAPLVAVGVTVGLIGASVIASLLAKQAKDQPAVDLIEERGDWARERGGEGGSGLDA